MPAALLVSKSPPLCGELTVHGAKNSVLPILAATLLCRTPCVLHNCPDILDVTHTLQILRHLGCSCERSGSTLSIDPRGFAENAVPPALAGSMRASSLFLGALLARTGAAALTLPGGCPAPHRLSPAGIPRSRRVRRRRRRDCPLPGGPAARRAPPPARPQRRRDGKRHAGCPWRRRLHHDRKRRL